MSKYSLEFILHTQGSSMQSIKNSLAEFAETLEVSAHQDSNDSGNNFKVSISTDEPTLIFDICAQLGRIRSVKIDEVR